jgi:hypothetical protein
MCSKVTSYKKPFKKPFKVIATILEVLDMELHGNEQNKQEYDP